MASRTHPPSETERQWFIGTRRTEHSDPKPGQYSSVPEYISRLHVSFTDLVLFSLIAIFWGTVFLMALQVGL